MFLLTIPALLLIGCSNDGKGLNGIIECYSIKATNNTEMYPVSWNYHCDYSHVYEFKDSKGNCLYADSSASYGVYNTSTKEYEYKYSTLRVFFNKYSFKYTEYYYSRFVGYLTVENNCYLNLETRTVDYETKWSEYLYDENPGGLIGANKEAYEKAKNGYYHIYVGSGTEFYNLYLNGIESKLDRHEYTIIGNDWNIQYTEKWF